MNLTKFGVNLDHIKSINFDKYEKNFTFIVDGKKYEISRFLADFISPTVNNYHNEDETMNEITLNTNIKRNQNEDYFNKFLSLFTFEDQEIDNFHHKIYCEYFLQLGNTKEYSRLHQAYVSDITPENVIDRLIQENEVSDDELIKYASINFEKISKEEFKKLEIDILEEIISNEFLKIDNEDSLLEFILDLYQIDNKYSVLFEKVIFNNVTLETFNKFINEFEVENINSCIWSGIRERILSKQTIEINDRYNRKERIIHKDYNESGEVNGLLRYLTDQTGGNIHDNGTVFISSNSIFKESNHPKNLVNFREDDLTCYQSLSGIPDAFVCFDLKDKKIQLTSYTIKTHKNIFHLKNWAIEVSNDEAHWLKIDEHVNETELNQSKVVRNFQIKKETEFYRFIRLRQTGFSWANTNQTLFYYIEFYGNTKEFFN